MAEDNRGMDFGSAPMVTLMLRMSLPAIAAQLVNLLYSIVDRIYIGHIEGIGIQALAGVGVCSTILILIGAFSQIVGGGGAPLAAYALGKGEPEQAKRLLGNGFVLLMIFTMVLMIPCYLCMQPILYRVGASDATYVYARDYLRIYLAGTVFVEITLGLNPFLTCQGKPMAAMFSVLLGAVVNIVLDPLFIFVLHMGVAGAALATVIAQACSCCWILYFLTSRRAVMKIEKQCCQIYPEITKSMVSLGISPFVMASTESLVGFVLNSQLSAFGDIYVGALTIMQSCMQFIGVPLSGFTQGSSPIVSYNYGHGDSKRVKDSFKVMVCVMFGYNLVLCLLMIIFPKSFAAIFTSDTDLQQLVGRVMPLFLAGMTIFGLQRACQTMFVALNQPRISLFIALLRKVFLLVPLALILPRFFEVNGVFAAEAVADATAAICCTLIFARKFPVIVKSMEEDQKKHVRGNG